MKLLAPVALSVAAVLAGGAGPVDAESSPDQLAVEVLRDAMAGGNDHLRLFAIERSTTLKTPGLLAEVRALASSPDRVVRSHALDFLAANDLQGSREIFLSAVQVPFRSVRLRALKALLSLYDPALVPRFVKVLHSDPDPDIRALAARGLGALGTRGGEDAGPALRQALDDPHPSVQEGAVDGLVAIGEVGVGLDLLDRVRKAPPGEAERLLRLVGRVPDRALVPRLGKLLQAGEPTVRIAAAAGASRGRRTHAVTRPVDTEAVRAHYARVAADYAARREAGLAGLLRRREQRAVLELLTAGSGESVLDVGCGDGALAAELVGRGSRVVAVDLVPAMARSAGRRGALPVVADMHALGVRPGFDWAAWIGSSEFAARLDTAAGEVARSLRHGGRLVMLFPRRNWLGLTLLFHHRAGGVPMRLRSRQAVVRSLVKAGFDRPDAWRRCAAAWICRARHRDLAHEALA